MTSPLADERSLDLDRQPSDRSFGVLFAVVFAAAAAFLLLDERLGIGFTAVGLSALCLIPALARPGILGPLNRLWTKLGLLLHRFTNPVIMGVLFVFLFVTFGFVARVFGYDPLRRRKGSSVSYWVARDPARPASDTMKNQF